MGRLKALPSSRLDPEQRALFDAITRSKRSEGRLLEDFLLENGALRGPFDAWLRAPRVGQPAQRLGEAIRFETCLSPRLRELAILTVAARWRADYEWWAHSRIARSAGLADETIDALKEGAFPSAADPEELAVHRLALELMDSQRLSDEVYREAVARLGESGVVELVTLLGYYTLVSMVLNTFQVAVPGGETPPFSGSS